VSVRTTTPLKVAPPAGGVALTAGTLPTWGAWVEVIAATAARVAVAGVQLHAGSYATDDWELDLGTGAPGAEVSLGTLRLCLTNSGALSIPSGLLLPVPIGGIAAGVRVAVRARSSGAGPAAISLNYYEALSSDHVTISTQVLSASSLGTASPTLTPSATPWANSAWVTLVAQAPGPIGLLGVVYGEIRGAGLGIEFDLGTGASGAETVLTTLRQATGGGTRAAHVWLPAVYPIATGTRVAVRLRKAGTDTLTLPMTLLYYRRRITSSMFTTGGTTGPLSWIELTLNTESD
jgi:hypothetical protein